MAATTDVQTVNITINGIPLVVPKGELIVESAKRLGIEIPIFCYHPRMKPVGMCRMCLIEMGSKGPDGSIRMMPKPQTACSLPATEGLVINTDTEKLHQDRKGVLEFLLVNHPLDCPICDRGGECPLQNNTLFYGPSTSRFIESKRHAPKAFPLSKYVTLDLERCIQCGRCVRFTEEISGDAQLAFRFRGASMQPSTFELRDFSSKFSGNTIEICPVGALTNTTYRFRARPWDLETKPSICTNCGNGCNIFIDHREQTLVRVQGRTNEAINEEWTCDRGKFGFGYYNSEKRLKTVLIRDGDRLAPGSWSVALRQVGVALGAGKRAALVGGATVSNEDVFSLGLLFSNRFGPKSFSFFAGLDYSGLATSGKSSSIKSFESKKSVLIFGSDLAEEEPILYLRIRKAWLNFSTQVVVASEKETDADGFASLVLRYKPGTEASVAEALSLEISTAGSDLSTYESKTGVSVRDIRDAAALMRGASPAIVTTHALLAAPEVEKIFGYLRDIASSEEGSFDCYPLVANGAGAELIGRALCGSSLASTREILEKCVSGDIQSLWVVGGDLLNYPDQELVRSALESVEFLVVQDFIATELTAYATVVLPMTAPAESEASWTNIEGRVQRIRQALPVRGESKPAWLVASELAAITGGALQPFTPEDVYELLATKVPTFSESSLQAPSVQGALLA